MHENIKEQLHQQTEKYYEKLPKTIEKQEEWQLNKTDFYTTAESNSFDLFDDSHVEPSGVQALKNPNPLKDVEALVVLGVAVLV